MLLEPALLSKVALVGAGLQPWRGVSFETLVGLIGRLSHLEVPGQRAE